VLPVLEAAVVYHKYQQDNVKLQHGYHPLPVKMERQKGENHLQPVAGIQTDIADRWNAG
jgi:hypothetical protein